MRFFEARSGNEHYLHSLLLIVVQNSRGLIASVAGADSGADSSSREPPGAPSFTKFNYMWEAKALLPDKESLLIEGKHFSFRFQTPICSKVIAVRIEGISRSMLKYIGCPKVGCDGTEGSIFPKIILGMLKEESDWLKEESTVSSPKFFQVCRPILHMFECGADAWGGHRLPEKSYIVKGLKPGSYSEDGDRLSVMVQDEEVHKIYCGTSGALPRMLSHLSAPNTFSSRRCSGLERSH